MLMMRGILLFHITLGIFILTALAGMSWTASASSSSLTVTLSPRPADGVETVLLRYEGAGNINLTGWTLADDARVRHTFGSLTLSDGETYLICNWGTRADCDVHILGSAIWNDGGDTLSLRDEQGEIVLTITYTSSQIDQTFSETVWLMHEPDHILGCTDNQALNFNPLATSEDGSCRYELTDDETDPDPGGDDDQEEETFARLVPLARDLIPRVPGHCPQGYAKWQDYEIAGTEWVIDDTYDSVVLVGGPAKVAQNRDGGRYLVSDGVLRVGLTLARDWHDIAFVCVK